MSRSAVYQPNGAELGTSVERVSRGGRGFSVTRVFLLALVALSCFRYCDSVGGQTRHSDEIRTLVAPYLLLLERLSRVELTATAEYAIRSDESVKYGKSRDAVVWAGEHQFLCRRKQDNLLLSQKSYVTHEDSGRGIDTNSDWGTHTNSVLIDGGHLYVQHRSDRAGVQLTDYTNLAVTFEGRGVAGVTETAPISIVSRYMEASAVIFGLIGHYHLEDYLSEDAEKRLRREDGLEVIEARSRFGTMTLWLDPNQGFQPRRIKVSKSGTDLHSPSSTIGKPDRVTNEIQMNGSQIWPEGGIRQVNILVDFGDDTIEVDGFHFAKSMTVSNELLALSGSAATTTTEVSVTSLVLNPEFTEESFRPLLHIPEGYSVTVQGASHLSFKYENHKVVPGGGIEILETPQPYDFNPRRGLVIGVNAILFSLCLVVVVCWIALRLKSAAGDKNGPQP